MTTTVTAENAKAIRDRVLQAMHLVRDARNLIQEATNLATENEIKFADEQLKNVLGGANLVMHGLANEFTNWDFYYRARIQD